MAPTTDLFSDVLVTDGEGFDTDDVNHWCRGPTARLAGLLERRAGCLASVHDPDVGGENDDDVDLTSLVYTLRGGDAVLWADGSPTNEVRVTAGAIFQKVGTTDGDDPQFLPYVVRDADVALTVANGDATHPRIDVVQVKLEVVDADATSRDFEDGTTRAKSSSPTAATRRRVQATWSVKQGTAAATPAYPAPDSGYAVLGAVHVPATWTGASGFSADGTGASSAGLRQCSVPLDVEPLVVPASAFDYSTAVNWALQSTGYAKAAGGAGTDLRVWVPGGAKTRRVVGVEVLAEWETSGAAKLRRMSYTVLGWNHTDASVFDLSSKLVNADGTFRSYFAHLGDVCDASSDSDPSAAAGPVGDPCWAGSGKGGPCERPVEQLGPSSTTGWLKPTALLLDGGTNSQVIAVVFHLAG